MAQGNILLERILRGRSDQTINFRQLCSLLHQLGFNQRVRGSHHIFSRDDIAEILNIQPRHDGTAKPYQVKQIRNLILKYNLAEKGIDNGTD
jgi:predicted RNA binding protein YcfA (HicA-like mRNA interferase family)